MRYPLPHLFSSLAALLVAACIGGEPPSDPYPTSDQGSADVSALPESTPDATQEEPPPSPSEADGAPASGEAPEVTDTDPAPPPELARPTFQVVNQFGVLGCLASGLELGQAMSMETDQPSCNGIYPLGDALSDSGQCCMEDWTLATSEDTDATTPCGPDDGTCISGFFEFAQEDYVMSQGDIGEVWLFYEQVSGGMLPMMSYTQVDPDAMMPFKFAHIPDSLIDICHAVWLGGRLDVGGNTQGECCDPRDPNVFETMKPRVFITPGCQVDGVRLVR